MSNLIRDIYIESFRGIDNLQLNDLQQINILTGDNNCGKTSVLEVLESYENPGSINLWRSLVRKETRMSPRGGMSYYEGFNDLFNINSDEKYLNYSISQNDGQVTDVKLIAEITVDELSAEFYEEIVGIRYLSEDKNESSSGEMIAVPRMQIQTVINGITCESKTFYEGQNNYRMNEISRYSTSDEKKVVHISPFRHTEGFYYLNEIFDYPELYEEMLQILKEYDETIISINYDVDDNSMLRRGTYKILSRTHNKALPLNVYGDGMKKAILLMSAVIKARDGILLLDEFETAIHTSAMNKTFKWILDTCIRLNVQLFMTSHSKEAINKILKCSPENRDKMAVYTLYKDKGGMTARRLTGEKAVIAQDDMGLELR